MNPSFVTARLLYRIAAILAWVLAAVQVACLVLSVLYFFLVPILFSTIVVVCLVWAAWLVSRARAVEPTPQRSVP